GVKTSESATGSTAIAPYAGVQLFAQSATDQMTVIVALNSTTLGTLSTTGAGTVSADGSTVTLAGTPASLDAALAAIAYTPATGALGKAVLDLSVTDANGTIAGQTTIAVSNAGQTVALSLAALGSRTGSTTITVSTPASEHDVLTATSGGTIANGMFMVSGTVAADAAALAGLKVATGTGSATPSLQVHLFGTPASLTDTGTGTGHDIITSDGGNSISTGSSTTTVVAGLGDTISAGSGSVLATGSQPYTFLGGSSVGDTVTGSGSFTAGTGGRSLLTASTGATFLRAGGSNDTLVGGASTVLYGSAGHATVLRTAGGDVAIGADGSIITGPTSGAVIVVAQSGNETVIGSTGSMNVIGGRGHLDVTLGAGRTTVTGGAGTQTVHVGAHAQAVLNETGGTDAIGLQKGVSTQAQLQVNGFLAGRDLITLTGYGTTAAQAVVQTQPILAGSPATVLTLSDGASITLSGVSHFDVSSLVLA
ncbi:MAG: hypothetical protein ACRYG8_27910, partial [Janthinobacterium lividum]